MKQNIFANAVPQTVDLPFATITFMPEPVKADVTSLADLPNVVLSVVEQRSALVHQFYMKVTRKPGADTAQIDWHRAEDLVQEHVMTAIRQFGDDMGKDDGEKAMNFEPHFPPTAYELNAARPDVLSPDSYRQYFMELITLAVPSNILCRNPHADAFSLYKNEHGTRFSMLLAPGLEMTVSTQEADVWAGRHTNDPQYILGTAKLLGKKAYVQISPSFNAYNPHRTIRNWITQDVLHDSIQERLGVVLGESFGPMADDFIDTLLDGVGFDLA